MTQLSSNTIVYNQIFYKIREFVVADLQNSFATLEDRTAAYNKLLQDIYENVAQPITQFEPFIKGEPPISGKVNRYAQNFADDLNIVAKQIDFLNAKTVNVFNMFMKEIENEKKYLERIGSKSKILQMYTKSPSNDIVYYGDTFDNMDKIDITKIGNRLTPHIANGEATLPIGSIRAVKPNKVILNKNGGFLGNNHQVIRALSSDGSSEYKFIFEDTPNIASIITITDSNPLTFMELEALNVNKASGTADLSLLTENEFCYLDVETGNTSVPTNTLINWSDYDVTKPLEASFAIEYPVSLTNCIEVVPYFGSSKILKIRQVVLTKKDGSTFDALKAPVYIGSSLTPLNLEVAKNYFYNKATIRFPEAEIIKAEVFCSQDVYDEIQIGHVYWKPNYEPGTASSSPFDGQSRFNPDAINKEIYAQVEYDKYALVPLITKPNELKRNGTTTKTVNVAVTTKTLQRQMWMLTLNCRKIRRGNNPTPGATPNLDPKIWKFYFNGWKANRANGINLSTNINNQPGSITGAKLYTSQLEGGSDYADLINYVATNPTITVGTDSYILTGVNFEYVVRTDPPVTTNYPVPVISQKEYYQAKRLAIGLRDISLTYETYASQAEIVSKPFLFDKNIEALMLSVDSSIDQDSIDLIDMSYYVSVEDGPWIEISPVQLDNRGIAEVIVFNKNLSETAALPGVAYLNSPDVPKIIKKVAVKIAFSKSRVSNITPSIYSYELIAKVES